MTVDEICLEEADLAAEKDDKANRAAAEFAKQHAGSVVPPADLTAYIRKSAQVDESDAQRAMFNLLRQGGAASVDERFWIEFDKDAI